MENRQITIDKALGKGLKTVKHFANLEKVRTFALSKGKDNNIQQH